MYTIEQAYNIAENFIDGEFKGYLVNTNTNLVYQVLEWEGGLFIPKQMVFSTRYDDFFMTYNCYQENEIAGYKEPIWDLIIYKAEGLSGNFIIAIDNEHFCYFGKNYNNTLKIINKLDNVTQNNIGPFLFDNKFNTFEIKAPLEDEFSPHIYKFKNQVSEHIIILELDTTLVDDPTEYYTYYVVDTNTKEFLLRDDDYTDILLTLNNSNTQYESEPIDIKTITLINSLKE